MWLVRAGREARFTDDFVERGVIAIGWEEMGPLDPGVDKPQILSRYRSAYPSHSEGKAGVGASQVLRYLEEVSPGDVAVTYDRDRRRYLIGTIKPGLRWEPDGIPGLPRVRSVGWDCHVSRDALSQASQRALTALLTLSQVRDEVAAELRAKKIGLEADLAPVAPESVPEPVDTVDSLEVFGQDLIEQAKQVLEDRIAAIGWEDMQHLVAGILRAMGYRTEVSERGSDRGVDIFASPDGLGLEEPRIFVEVKHRRNSAMGSQDLRSFLGGRSAGDRCLYVSTGGFSKDARYEADRAQVPIRLIGLTDLRDLLIEHYANMDEAARSLIPLRRIYVPAD